MTFSSRFFEPAPAQSVDGQLAGAFYREHGIPESWCAKLAYRDLIERFAERLLDLSQSRP